MHFFHLLLSVAFFFWLNNPSWVESLDDAKTIAQKEDKLILLVFSGSDWCRNCILLDHEVFSGSEFGELAQTYLVLLKADFPRKRKNQLPGRQQSMNQKLAGKFNPQGEFPKVVLMDADEKVIFESSYQQGRKANFMNELKALVGHD